MDRLTARENGNAYYPECFERCDGDNNYCHCCELDDRICDRLAEYEDTGLSPAEVAELAQAKADGRVVVLPCKVGDTVYVVVTDCDCAYAGNMNDCAYCDYVVMPCDDFFRYDEDEWECGFKPHVREDKFSIAMYEQLGKTIFLTRGEAEKALRERENNV